MGYISDTLYFFNNGTWSNLTTTGVNNASVSGNYIQLPNGSKGRFNQSVTMTDYKYLKLTGYNTDSSYKSYFTIAVSTRESATSYTASNISYSSTNGETVTVILDISSISGNYYIYIQAYGYNSSTSTLIGGSSYYGMINAIRMSKHDFPSVKFIYFYIFFERRSIIYENFC